MTVVAAVRGKRVGWSAKSIISSPFASATIHAGFLLASDVVSAFVAVGLAFVVARYISTTMVSSDFVPFTRAVADRASVASPLLLICALWLNSKGHYLERIPFWTEVKDIIFVAALGLVAEGFIQYAVNVHPSRLWIVSSWFLLVPMIVAMRGSIKWLLTILGIRRLDVFLFGESESFLAAIKTEKLLGYVVVGSSKSSSPETAAAVVRATGAKLAVIAIDGLSDPSAGAIAHSLSQAGVRFALCPPLAGLGLASMRPLVLFGHNAMLLVERHGLAHPFARMIKRLVDIIIATVGILVFGPIALIFAVAVRLDGGPSLYAQRRIGRDGRIIRV
jgi:Bacterial sugar transferase